MATQKIFTRLFTVLVSFAILCLMFALLLQQKSHPSKASRPILSPEQENYLG